MQTATKLRFLYGRAIAALDDEWLVVPQLHSGGRYSFVLFDSSGDIWEDPRGYTYCTIEGAVKAGQAYVSVLLIDLSDLKDP